MIFMRKSKALTIIRKRKRNGGLIYKQNEEEHPLILAIKATTAFIQGTIILMKEIAEADDPNAAFEQFEKAGLFKLQQETGDKLNTAIREYTDRIGATPAQPDPSPDPTKNQ
jgi:hypothetical protein